MDKLKLEVLFQAIERVTGPLKFMRTESKNTSAEIKQLQSTLKNLEATQKKIAGSSVNGSQAMASYQQHLTESVNETNLSLHKQYQELNRINQVMRQLNAARANYDKTIAMRDKALNAGASLTVAGGVMGAPIIASIKQYASFEDAMLGVAKQVDGARDKNGKLTPTYYEMADAIKAMSERLPMAANDIAAIVEAGARMGIQGKDNLILYAETTAKMADAMQMSVEEAGDQIAKTAQLYKIPIASIKMLGDTINFLDDNALSKGNDIVNVLNRIAGTAATVNMNFKEAAALGSTFLSSGSTPEIAATATNAVIRELGIANMQTKKFNEGLAMIKMNGAEIQKSMSGNATGTILKVLDALNKLPKDKQLEATTRLFGKEYGDDVAKLANNIAEYRRQLQLVQSAQATDSMDRESSARLQNLSAQYQLLRNQLQNTATDIGSLFKPALVDVLDSLKDILGAVRGWMAEHPRLTAFIIKSVAYLAIFTTALGALFLGIASILGPLAVFRYGMALLSILFPALLPSLAAAAVAFGPFVLAGMAAGAAAAYIYNHWDKIVNFFKTTNWSGLGMDILHGIEIGLDAATLGLYSKLKKIAEGISSTVRSALGIKSPSRVFAEIGKFTLMGMAGGLDTNQGTVYSKISQVAKRMTALAGGMAVAMPALAGNVQFDNRAPIGRAAAMPGQSIGEVHIHIHQAPGQSPQDVAAEVERALERMRMRDASNARASMRDRE
ncbi:phage tail tape measure protein [Methylophilus sp. 3sh_L]|uniref:phage tail tape measure protein n=1 Tax=Methylophilus sp. 3sh_L TaxID=3377114 RepID=UPI00398EFBB2